jgi:hypothetical protein
MVLILRLVALILLCIWVRKYVGLFVFSMYIFHSLSFSFLSSLFSFPSVFFLSIFLLPSGMIEKSAKSLSSPPSPFSYTGITINESTHSPFFVLNSANSTMEERVDKMDPFYDFCKHLLSQHSFYPLYPAYLPPVLDGVGMYETFMYYIWWIETFVLSNAFLCTVCIR